MEMEDQKDMIAQLSDVTVTSERGGSSNKEQGLPDGSFRI